MPAPSTPAVACCNRISQSNIFIFWAASTVICNKIIKTWAMEWRLSGKLCYISGVDNRLNPGSILVWSWMTRSP